MQQNYSGQANINTIAVMNLNITSSCLLFKTERFEDWILPPSSGSAYSVGLSQLSNHINAILIP
jgi:hypothetical protein